MYTEGKMNELSRREKKSVFMFLVDIHINFKSQASFNPPLM